MTGAGVMGKSDWLDASFSRSSLPLPLFISHMKILVGQSLRIGVYQCVSTQPAQPIKPIDGAETEQIRVPLLSGEPLSRFPTCSCPEPRPSYMNVAANRAPLRLLLVNIFHAARVPVTSKEPIRLSHGVTFSSRPTLKIVISPR